MKCYAVIDTNVLVSALLSQSENTATMQILDHLINETIIPIYSGDIIREYKEVLMRKKFGFSKKMVQILIAYIRKSGIEITPAPLDEKLPDPKDLPFYEVFMDTREKDSFLVTGNIKHFPQRSYIVTPRQLIEILEKR